MCYYYCFTDLGFQTQQSGSYFLPLGSLVCHWEMLSANDHDASLVISSLAESSEYMRITRGTCYNSDSQATLLEF